MVILSYEWYKHTHIGTPIEQYPPAIGGESTGDRPFLLFCIQHPQHRSQIVPSAAVAVAHTPAPPFPLCDRLFALTHFSCTLSHSLFYMSLLLQLLRSLLTPRTPVFAPVLGPLPFLCRCFYLLAFRNLLAFSPSRIPVLDSWDRATVVRTLASSHPQVL
ncbi:hypothetical protein DENSPDRAFT_843692 [Dentipellis sp. KUC8613]|nr:hypothetical protein DENSPDRAFT_843692 [Dentipellis sp. KUC8613]